MKKTFISILLLLATVVLAGCESATSETGDSASGHDKPAVAKSDKAANDQPISSAEMVADKLEVYYFHRTARCNSCKTIGAYVKETMEQKYASEIKDGKIVFRELNVEEPENEGIARKFQAAGSSLFINRIIKGEDNIEQDMNVWRLLGDEQQFKSYLENKIDSYLGV